MHADWPPLPYEEWRQTRDTLHMYTQVIGKLRLALSPFEPQWANVPLYLTARGLTTSPVPVGLRTIDAEFDLIDHVLVLRSSDGYVERRPLGGAVADLYRDVTNAPAGAAWSETSGLFILPYDTVRAGADAPRAILDFLSSTYSVAAGLLRWNTDLTHVVAPAQGPSGRRF